MHCSNFSDRIYVEKTPEQCSLNHHRSQRAKEDAWQDIYSSIGLDDGQVYDQDGLKENSIMWRTPHREGDRRKGAKEKRKSITVAWTFRNSELNNSASTRTTISSNFISFCACSYLKSLLAVISFAKGPVLLPTLYKFIVLGSLGLYSNNFGFGLKIVSLQYTCITIIKYQI